jgi:hypothetical protein
MGNRKKKKEKRTFKNGEKENLKVLGKGSWYQQCENDDMCENECDNHSASFHKLAMNTEKNDLEESVTDSPSAENYIINIQQLQESLNHVTVCSACKEGVLLIKEKSSLRKGIVPFLYVDCSNEKCSTRNKEFPIQKKNGHIFDINKRTVLAARSSGGGETAVAKMFAFMGLPPPPTQKSWNSHQVTAFTKFSWCQYGLSYIFI